MATMLVSKRRFLVLAAGLLTIAVYLGIALSLSEGLRMAQFAESKSEQPTAHANYEVIEVEEKSGQSNADQPKEGGVPTAPSGSKASKSTGATVGQIKALTGKANADTDSHALVTSVSPSVKVTSNPGNPLDDTIDPDVPGIARLALTADFQSLVESGVDVSTAVRYIDERVGDGKYGEELIRR